MRPREFKCADCREPVTDPDSYRWDQEAFALLRVCADHRQGTREQVLDALGRVNEEM